MSAVITGACRTPIGSFLGSLRSRPAPDLAALVLREVLHRAGVSPETVDEVILGHVVAAGVGQAPARQAALRAGIPPRAGAMTVNKVCGSGLTAVLLGAQAIAAGEARVVLAGGMENMSGAPYLLPKAREGYRMGDGELIDAVMRDGLFDPFGRYPMGITGEICAREHGVSREDQDRWAVESNRRAMESRMLLAREIVPVPPGPGKADPGLETDECPRETSPAALAALRPAFQEEGSVTAGNASKLADGAAAVCLMSAEGATAAGTPIRARVVAGARFSGEPSRLMTAPVEAIRRVTQRAGWDSADLYEINEPFAVATVAIVRALGFSPARVNVRGGAVALGHPIGATGCRLVVTLLHALEDLGLTRGVASLCLGGGEAVAIAIERPAA